MYSFMAAGRPACPLRQECGVIDIAEKNSARLSRLLEMAFQTERLIAFGQHALIDRAMRRMAGGATFAHRFVFENKRAALCGVTLQARLICAQKRDAATFDRLLQVCASTLNSASFVRIVAIRAAHLAFEHRMTMRQLEAGPHVGVTLEACGRRFARINDRMRAAAALDVQTSRAVTRFAADVLGVFSLRFQTCVRGRAEITGDRFMAGRAIVGTHEFRAGNTGRCENWSATLEGATGKQNHGQRDCSPRAPKQFLAATAGPSS